MHTLFHFARCSFLIHIFNNYIDYEDNFEEIIAQDGIYEKNIPAVTLTHNCKEVKSAGVSKKQPESRVWSGSNDPDVLKEQVLIGLFDLLWPSLAHTLEPLFSKYAFHLINQSVEFSSMSRESSSKSRRAEDYGFGGNHLQELSSVRRSSQGRRSLGFGVPPSSSPDFTAIRRSSKDQTVAKPSDVAHTLMVNRSETGQILRNKRSQSCRASSVVGRLAGHVKPSPTEFHEIFQLGDGRVKNLSSTIEKNETMLLLPSLTNNVRPLSSRSPNNRLAPVPSTDQRPASTSSFTRLKYQNKFNLLGRTATIDEGGVDDIPNNRDGHSNQPWLRHASRLPPITNKFSNAGKEPVRNISPLVPGDFDVNRSSQLLSLVSKEEANRTLDASEPLISWVVERVEEVDLRSSCKKSLYSDPVSRKTTTSSEQFKRYSHH